MAVICGTSMALAVDIDLSKYSDSELKQIISLVNQEMMDRKIIKSAKLPAGRYEVGIDIPAGKYEITEQTISTFMGPTVAVFKDNTKTDNILMDSIIFEMMEAGSSFVVELKNGNVLDIDASVILTVFSGIRFE